MVIQFLPRVLFHRLGVRFLSLVKSIEVGETRSDFSFSRAWHTHELTGKYAALKEWIMFHSLAEFLGCFPECLVDARRFPKLVCDNAYSGLS